ncbi:GNAT family N-acetyltransferase [Aureispira anguillae]|uniref:GNAT family N-acetyltransferase n=1 Tax=Aureispira anguillae TaxID=2864201 RepID=A0A915YGB5_9BACT|nr:GNAT family N-acetyltransferase [Aureispira anguillae]BDS12629.1 GNAT family N-acetyltransferase [Aureispira anguillae]
MQKSILQNANLANLTDLWRIGSSAFQSYYSNADFDYCWINDAAWPNRLWFHQMPNSESILKAKKVIHQAPFSLTIPYWDIYPQDSQPLLIQEGFEAYFEQMAMVLKLENQYSISKKFKLQKVTQESEAKQWTDLFIQAFRYRISPLTILKNRSFSYYIAYYENQAIGTALTNPTHNNIGVHAIGVPPQHRRKGLAALIMQQLINWAVQEKRDYMTLQASNMGKGLYLKLGFEEQFLITNYRLPKQ